MNKILYICFRLKSLLFPFSKWQWPLKLHLYAQFILGHYKDLFMFIFIASVFIFKSIFNLRDIYICKSQNDSD